jgi:hypothetical protein
MVGIVTLSQALADGGRIVWEPADRPRLHVPSRWTAALHREAPEVREVLRRAVAFRAQIAGWDRPAIPLLVMPDAPTRRADACVSCGAMSSRWRCLPCLAAVYIALDDLAALGETIAGAAGDGAVA